MRTQTKAAALALTLASLVPAGGAFGYAAADEAPRGATSPLEAKAAVHSDATLVARRYGWEIDATVRYLDDSRRFTRLAGELAGKHAGTFAGAVAAERPGGAAVVRFVGDPPADAFELAARSGLAVKVVGDARFSEKELQDRAASVHKSLLESGFKQVATATATATDGVVATVHGDGEVKLPAEFLDGSVAVSRSRAPVARDEHTQGGAPLLVNGVFNCTSGFTVQNGAGTTGVATAGHCTGLNQYRQPTDGLTYGLTHQGEHYGFWGDYEWKTTSHVEPAEYFATATEVREVNSVSSGLPVNTTSCVYGRSSNARSCDQVYSNFVIATFSGPTHFFLMAMDSDNTIPGDSGGPWSFGTEADGIHKGDLSLGGATRNVWSRADLLPFALGVSVRTQ